MTTILLHSFLVEPSELDMLKRGLTLTPNDLPFLYKETVTVTRSPKKLFFLGSGSGLPRPPTLYHALLCTLCYLGAIVKGLLYLG